MAILSHRALLTASVAVVALVTWRLTTRPVPPPPDDATLTAGRTIYRHGESRAQPPITAVLAPGEAPVPAAVLPCVGCHGKTGRGRPEGGVVPADLTPETLSIPRRASADRPGRPAYTPALLKRAITMGFDAGGRPLASTMPRFQMSIADLTALVAYLPQLGHEPEPGVTDDEIRIAVVGSPAARDAVRAYFDATTRAGGVYRRRIVIARDDEAFAGIAASDRPSLASDDTPWIDDSPHGAPAPAIFHLFPTARPRDQATVTRAAALLLVAALRACGRDLTREQLVQSLEAIHRVDAGLDTPVSFARGQHIGVAAD